MALHGVNVLEFSGLAPGPFCGQILADFGANVITIDRNQFIDTSLARGKKSIIIDIKQPNARSIIYRMIPKIDVLIDPFRPGVMERLGLGPEELLKINPLLIYARLTGFGQTGPYSQMAGHDINYLAVGGVLSALGRRGSPPFPPGNLLADFAGGGTICALGILLCLYERTRSHKGQVIDCAMQDGALYLSTYLFKHKASFLWNRERGNNVLDSGAPFYDCYQCKDGGYMAVGAIEPQFFKVFIEKIGLKDQVELSSQLDRTTWQKTRELITEQFKTKTMSEWQQVFDNTDACTAPVLELNQISNHPHNAHRKILLPCESSSDNFYLQNDPAPAPRLSRTPALSLDNNNAKTTRPTTGGEHTVLVLKQFGFETDQISQLLLHHTVIDNTNIKKAAL